MSPRIGSMFSGYGGLDCGIAEVTGGTTVWVADVCGTPGTKSWPHKTPCKSPCTILAHRFPDAPNLGDVAAIDWSTVEPVEILCAGFPCQDVSTAGKRAGLRDGTRTGLWSEVIRAIVALQPRLVVLENVPGIFTAPAAGDVEPCTWCVGDGPDGDLRALDAVLADLAEVGFDAEWIVVPASGVGAAHKRERWFLAAHPKGQPWSFVNGDGGAAADASGLRRGAGRTAGPGEAPGGRPSTDLAGRGDAPLTLLGTPTARMWKGSGPVGSESHQWLVDHGNVEAQVLLLPTPAVNDMGAAYTPEERDAWTEKMKAAHGNGNGHGKSLNIEAQRLAACWYCGEPRTTDGCDNCDAGPHAVVLLPTPEASRAGGTAEAHRERKRRGMGRPDPTCTNLDLLAEELARENRWGDYAAAITRWESVMGRPAPEPTQTSTKGNPQLSPRFTEWLMGLPAGWITDVPGITRNEALKACGNGVVPQQAAEALRTLLGRMAVAA